MTAQPKDLAHEAHLKYVSDSQPGFLRTGSDKNFNYYTDSGQRISDKKILKRIEDLGIPPAWDYVWISPFENGHLQATGRDQKGRKQYIYHQKWNEISSQNKFNKMIFFSGTLPEVRFKIEKDMKLSGLKQEKILATIVWLLDNTYIRVGNEEYAKDNKHYGLTTLRNKHVEVSGHRIVFEFTGKSGKKHFIDISHPLISKTVKKLEELPGYELFQYIDENEDRHPIDSEDVNEYLKKIAGEPVSAKDFRTWGGTVSAADHLVLLGEPENSKKLEKNINEAILKASKKLGNTPSICRNYYIHPVVIDSYQKKVLVPHFKKYSKSSKIKGLDNDEYALALLLKQYA